jgi:hypothetical protein
MLCFCFVTKKKFKRQTATASALPNEPVENTFTTQYFEKYGYMLVNDCIDPQRVQELLEFTLNNQDVIAASARFDKDVDLSAVMQFTALKVGHEATQAVTRVLNAGPLLRQVPGFFLQPSKNWYCALSSVDNADHLVVIIPLPAAAPEAEGGGEGSSIYFLPHAKEERSAMRAAFAVPCFKAKMSQMPDDIADFLNQNEPDNICCETPLRPGQMFITTESLPFQVRGAPVYVVPLDTFNPKKKRTQAWREALEQGGMIKMNRLGEFNGAKLLPKSSDHVRADYKPRFIAAKPEEVSWLTDVTTKTTSSSSSALTTPPKPQLMTLFEQHDQLLSKFFFMIFFLN